MLTGVTQMYLESEMALDGSLFDPEYRLFLSFVLEHDYYGIPIEYITEVKSWADVKIRPLVKAPDFLSCLSRKTPSFREGMQSAS